MTNELTLPPAIIESLTPLQRGWLNLAEIKKRIQADLQKAELSIQQKLTNIQQDTDLANIQGRIKDAKYEAAVAKDQRLQFTNMVKEKITAPLMEYEDRNDALIAAANKHELEIRLKAEAEANKTKALETEKAQLKSHIENEYFRIAANYRQELKNITIDGYKEALKNKPADLPAYIDRIKDFLKAVKLGSFNKFTRILVDDATAQDINKTVTPYNNVPDLTAALNEVDVTFAMFDEDSKNAAAAIQQAEQEQRDQVQALESEIALQTATNNLVAQAGITTVENMPKVKRKWEVVVYNEQTWALNVLQNFLHYWLAVMPYVAVKSIDRLTIGHMAKALGELYTADNKNKLSNLEIMEVAK